LSKQAWLNKQTTKFKAQATKWTSSHSAAAPIKHFWIHSAHMKVEKMLKYTYDRLKMTWSFAKHTLRFIQASSMWLCLNLGPYCYAMTGVIFHQLPNTYLGACGTNSLQNGEWIRRSVEEGFTYGVSVDRTNYDGTINLAALQVEYDIFNMIKPMNRFEREAFQSQYKTVGYTQYGDRYITIGRVRSGDPNTSLGNTLLSFISTHDTMVKLVGLGNFRLAGQGDDLLILTKIPFNPEKYRDMQLRDFGLIAKVSRQSQHPADFEFLSSHVLPAYYTSESNLADGGIHHSTVWAMTPLIGKSLPKVYYELLNQGAPAHTPMSWLKGVCVGLQTMVSHHPLYHFVNEHMLKLCGDVKPFVYDPDAKYKLRGVPGLLPHPLANQWLTHRYGSMYPLVACLLKQAISDTNQIPCILPMVGLDILIKRDT